MPLRVERRKNRETVEALLAGYERLESRARSLNAKLDELGESKIDVQESAEKLRLRSEILFAPGLDGFQAIEEVSCLREGLAHRVEVAEQSLQTRIISIQKRFRQIASKREHAISELGKITDKANAAIPKNSPNSEKNRIFSLIRELTESVVIPSSVSVTLTHEGIARLESVEAELRRVDERIHSIRNTLESELDALHRMGVEQKIAASNPTQKLSEFLKSNPQISKPDNEPWVEKLDNMMAEVAVLQDTSGWSDLLRRAGEIRNEVVADRRRSLYEGLMIECGVRLRKAREYQEWKAKMDDFLDAAAPYHGPGVDEIVQELDIIARAGHIRNLTEIEARLKHAINRRIEQQKITEKRTAILQALEELGYEVTDGMGTALVSPGSVLVQKDGESEYAIEVVTNADLSMIQTTMVRFGEPTEITDQERLRDKEHEEAWCSEHAILRRKIAKSGYDSEFKMKLDPGEHPIKVISRKSKNSAVNRTIKVKGQTRQHPT